MIELKAPNFYGKDGSPFLVRCPECDRENYGIAVASGQCGHCGFTALAIPKKVIDNV